MKKNVFCTLFLLILFLNCYNSGHAFDLDETVDDDIRKNYNPSKLTNDVGAGASADEALPDLPAITKYNSSTKKPDSSISNTIEAPKSVIYQKGNVKIHKGTVFYAASNGAVSDWQGKGAKIKFTSKSIVNGKGYTIPSGTPFWGEIIETHQPQISCNGGLVVIRIYAMTYKNQTIPIKGYITRANDKNIFLNNIKGKRTYLKTMYKKGNWGRTIFGRMLSLTINLGGSGSTILLSPFPLAYGTICLGANTLVSPITAFFSKGGHVSIPSGSNFKIKLLEDAYVD